MFSCFIGLPWHSRPLRPQVSRSPRRRWLGGSGRQSLKAIWYWRASKIGTRVQHRLRFKWYIPTHVWKQTEMRVQLPMTIQALPGAIGPLPDVPFIPSELVTTEVFDERRSYQRDSPAVAYCFVYSDSREACAIE